MRSLIGMKTSYIGGKSVLRGVLKVTGAIVKQDNHKTIFFSKK